LISTVLGSCVAVCIFDRLRKWGGMSHFLFPKAGRKGRPTPQYGNLAIPVLIRLLRKQGSQVENLEAQIFGGGKQSLEDSSSIGWRNVKIARKILKNYDVPLVSEDIGGVKGRRILYHTVTNEAIVMRTAKIRQGDWFPYHERLSV
ncbi:MAG: chemotaxis protein CheD, partial [Deltaproteobacteria bacterium]|nr:chemotaxis protein CheD [Deltaproteobacteria bacterium]